MDFQMYEATFADGALDHVVARDEADARAQLAIIRPGATITACTVARAALFAEALARVGDEAEAQLAAGGDAGTVKAWKKAERDRLYKEEQELLKAARDPDDYPDEEAL